MHHTHLCVIPVACVDRPEAILYFGVHHKHLRANRVAIVNKPSLYLLCGNLYPLLWSTSFYLCAYLVACVNRPEAIPFTLEYIINICVLILWHASIKEPIHYMQQSVFSTLEYIITICMLILWHSSINRVYTYNGAICILYSGVHHYHLRANLVARVSKPDLISLDFR